MAHNPQPGILLMCISLAASACTDAHSSATPAAPSPVVQPAPQPTSLQPTVSGIAPSTGTTEGDAWGTISGAQFEHGATVRLGDAQVEVFVRGDSTISFWTGSHPAGTVDVIVTNPGGLSSTLPGAYTFAPPGSFDFTGDWIAHAGPEYETDMRLEVRNNALVSLVCGSSEALLISPPSPVQDGAFSFLGDDGIAVSGRLVSPINAVGTINVPGCTNTSWWADRSGTTQSVRPR